jgi:hypothetical protein
MLWALLALSACASTPLPPPGKRTIPADFIGVNHAGWTPEENENALLRELGVKWIQNDLGWASIEPEQGTWDFSAGEKYVENARREGLKVFAHLLYDAPWIHPGGKSRKYVPAEALPLFIEYVEKTVLRFKGRVDAWGIWNEPNFGFWNGSAKEYYALAKAASEKIRELDPGTPVVAGNFLRVPGGFIDGMFKYGALGNGEVIAFHPYALNPSGALRLYDNMSGILKKNSYTGEIWITEVGFPVAGWYPTKTSEDIMPAHVVKTITGLAARGARIILWYQLSYDFNPGEVPAKYRDNSEKFFGLIYPDHTYSKGAHAYALCARYLAGSEYDSSLPVRTGVPLSMVSLYFKNGEKGNVLFLWNDRDSEVSLAISLSGSGEIHDISNGSSVFVPRETGIRIGAMPVIITWQDEISVSAPCMVKTQNR